MVAAVLPVGKYLGQFHTGTGESSYEIKLGRQSIALGGPEYAVWNLAHADYSEPGATPHTAATLRILAADTGVPEAGPIIEDLRVSGLLAQVLPVGTAMLQFAEQYRVIPLTTGLGNEPEFRDRFRLGMDDAPRISIGYDNFQIWAFCGEFKNLLEACEFAAKSITEMGRSVTLGSLLSAFVPVLPALISVDCAYIDKGLP